MSEVDPIVALDEIPQVAVASMNRTHADEVVLVNALGALIRQAQSGSLDAAAINQALAEWLEHTRAHFERENRLMEEYGFPPYPVHAQEHATVLDELEQIQDQWQQQQALEPLVEFVTQRWPQWFMRHVQTMDTITAQFLSNFVE